MRIENTMVRLYWTNDGIAIKVSNIYKLFFRKMAVVVESVYSILAYILN